MMVFGKVPSYKPKKKRKVVATNVAKKYKPEFVPLVVKARAKTAADDLPSAEIKPIRVRVPVRYEGEMLERELAAQKEIERKKKFVAPMHKSNYIYVGGEANADVKGWGRKNEVL
jgi:hypothetical protein